MKPRLVIAFLLLRTLPAQDFICPQNLILEDSFLGDSACSDQAKPGEVCQRPVTSPSTCTFSIFSNSSSGAGQLHIVGANLSPGNGIKIDGIFDSVRSWYGDTEDFELRAAFPLSGDPNIPFLNITIMTVDNATQMSFGYYLERIQVPSFDSTHKTSLSVAPGTLAEFIQLQPAKEQDYWEVQAQTAVALSAAISISSNPYDLLNFWYYEKDGSSLVLRGSAFTPGRSYVQSATQNILILYVLQSADALDGLIIVNDYQNLASCTSYDVYWSEAPDIRGYGYQNPTGTICLTLLNSIFNPQPTFLGSIDLQSYDNQSMNCQLMSGAPITDPVGTKTLLATYQDKFPIKFSYPQRLTTFASTFVATSDVTELTFVFKGEDQDTVPSEGQSGYLTTPGYPYSMNQTANFHVSGTDDFNFTLIIQNSLAPQGMLSVFGSGGILVNVTTVQGTILSFIEKKIEIYIDCGPAPTGGVYLTYRINRLTEALVTASSLTSSSKSTTSSLQNSSTTVGETVATTPKVSKQAFSTFSLAFSLYFSIFS